MHYFNYYNRLTIQQIYIFIETAECESITRSSENMHISHSAVSKNIQNMETALELQLFIREKQRIRLTKAGRVLYREMKNSLQHMDSAILKASQIQSVGSSILKIGMPTGTNPSSFLIETTEHFQTLFPDCRFYYEDYFYQQLPEKLKKKEVDLVVSYVLDTKNYQDNCVCSLLVESPYVACLHKSSPLAKRKSISLDELRAYNFLITDQFAGSTYAKMLSGLCAKYRFAPKTDFLSHSNGIITYNIQKPDEVVITDSFVMNRNPDVVLVPVKNEFAGLIIAYNSDDQDSLISRFVEESCAYWEGHRSVLYAKRETQNMVPLL